MTKIITAADAADLHARKSAEKERTKRRRMARNFKSATYESRLQGALDAFLGVPDERTRATGYDRYADPVEDRDNTTFAVRPVM